MPVETLILATEFCAYHRLDIDFVYLLEERGLIELVLIEQSIYVQPDQLGRLEQLVRLHRDLAVHADDLDIVAQLLERMEQLQEKVSQLQNRLGFYESTTLVHQEG